MGSQGPGTARHRGEPRVPPRRRGRGRQEPRRPGRPGVPVSCPPPSAPPARPGLRRRARTPAPRLPPGRPRPGGLSPRRSRAAGRAGARRLVSKHNGARAPETVKPRRVQTPAARTRCPPPPPTATPRPPGSPASPAPAPDAQLPPRPPRGPYLVESPVGAANLHRQLRHVGTAKAAGKRF